MDSKLILIIKKLCIAGLLVFSACFVFGNLNLAKGVMGGYVVFSVNILALAVIFRTLLNKNVSLGDSTSKKIAIFSLGIKIPLLALVLYYFIRVLGLPALNIFVGSILGMFVTGWLFFEDYLQNLAK